MAVKDQFKFPDISFQDNITGPSVDVAIEDLIPHRGPALMVDQIVKVDEGYRSIITHYTVPAKTWWTESHFPGEPIMPGVLLIEAAAQTGAILAACAGAVGLPALVRVDSARFFNPVRPDDSLFIYVELANDDLSQRKRVWPFRFYIQNHQFQKIANGQLTGVARR